MNKKIIIVLITITLLLLGLGAYVMMKNNLNKENDQIQKEENKTSPGKTSDKKVAVLYFSATGTTKTVAEYISKATGGTLIEIEPEEKYTASDLSYNDDGSRANREQNDPNSRPKIKNSLPVEEYDIIYLGYPIWWGTVPKIILTLMDTYDFKDKELIPFCTSGGSGIEASAKDLKNYEKEAIWHDGKRFSKSSQNEIEKWAIWK